MADLSKLEKQTDKLHRLEDMITKEHGSFVEYTPHNKGTFIGFGLHKEPAVAVQRVFMSKGTEVEEHSHPEHEYVLVYRGKFKVKREGGSYARMEGKESKEIEGIIGVGDGVYFMPNEKHSGVMLEDTWIISTTIPASGAYPDAD